MSVVRYGLLSTAQIGIDAHLPALRKSENSEVVSISSDPHGGGFVEWMWWGG